MYFNRVILCIIFLTSVNTYSTQKNIAEKKQDTKQSLWQRSRTFAENNKTYFAIFGAFCAGHVYGQLCQVNRHRSPNNEDLDKSHMYRLAEFLRPWLNKSRIDVDTNDVTYWQHNQPQESHTPLGLTTLGKIFWCIGLL